MQVLRFTRSLSTLQWALAFSMLLHAGLLMVRFVPQDVIANMFRSTELEVVLVNAGTDEQPPEKPQAVAQVTLAGGGEAKEEGRMVASPLPASPENSAGDDMVEERQQRVDEGMHRLARAEGHGKGHEEGRRPRRRNFSVVLSPEFVRRQRPDGDGQQNAHKGHCPEHGQLRAVDGGGVRCARQQQQRGGQRRQRGKAGGKWLHVEKRGWVRARKRQKSAANAGGGNGKKENRAV